uniref:Uncharacterized protein n=1 Tax=Oryza glumipatula TaxID=40148 RepID=A0A0E0A8Z4_9ORYZ
MGCERLGDLAVDPAAGGEWRAAGRPRIGSISGGSSRADPVSVTTEGSGSSGFDGGGARWSRELGCRCGSGKEDGCHGQRQRRRLVQICRLRWRARASEGTAVEMASHPRVGGEGLAVVGARHCCPPPPHPYELPSSLSSPSSDEEAAAAGWICAASAQPFAVPLPSLRGEGTSSSDVIAADDN